MTRVNVVPVEELCDQHCLAEHREITRIPRTIINGKARLDGNYPSTYRLGTGHVKFMYPRLAWLHKRYNEVHKECIRRGFNVIYRWPPNVPKHLYRDWTPDEESVKISRERIQLKMPKKARWSNKINGEKV